MSCSPAHADRFILSWLCKHCPFSDTRWFWPYRKECACGLCTESLPPYFINSVRTFLNDKYRERYGPTEWPARWRGFNPLDFYSWSYLLGWVHTCIVTAYRNTVSWQCGRDSWPHNVSKVGYAVTLGACSVRCRYLAVTSKGWYGQIPTAHRKSP